jgi:carboxypeptidase PM20D1
MKKLLRLLFRILLLVIVIIAGIVTIKTAGVSSRQTTIKTITPPTVAPGAAERLAKAVQLPTISSPDQFDAETFLQFDTLIKKQYPLVDSMLERINITPLSLTFKWSGKNPDLLPVLLLGHSDVVPVEEGTENEWQVAPFSGDIKDDFIWGRGTLDDKLTIFWYSGIY